MPLLQVLLVIIVVGILLWLVETYLPLAQPIKRIFEAVVVIVLVVWLLQVFGVFAYLPNPRIGRIG
jgi:multisubunit Na+/H+ antiporter MnhB subunit